MPSALVDSLGQRQRRELAEFKSVLNDARNQVVRPVDVESMAQELVKSGGRDFVEMVRDLTTALENAKSELEDANRRYERLVADLERRGIGLEEERQDLPEPDDVRADPPQDAASAESDASADGRAEWEEWDRRFRALLG